MIRRQTIRQLADADIQQSVTRHGHTPGGMQCEPAMKMLNLNMENRRWRALRRG